MASLSSDKIGEEGYLLPISFKVSAQPLVLFTSELVVEERLMGLVASS